MIKTGIVISIISKKAGVMTSNGEFVYLKISKTLPKVGEIYTAELFKKNLYISKYSIIAASLMFLILSSIGAYSYYTPVTTVIISINPCVSLKANKWNKIISSKAVNSDGSLILKNTKLNYKSIDAALALLVKEAKTENFINDKYVKSKKIISVYFKSKKDSSIDISNFKNIIDSNNLNIKINVSSRNNRKIDITANNKKINISDFNTNSYKRDTTNKKSKIKRNPLNKTSEDVNTNMDDNKLSKNKEELKNNTKANISNDNKTDKNNESENKNSNNDESSTFEKYDYSNEIRNNVDNDKNESIENSEIHKEAD